MKTYKTQEEFLKECHNGKFEYAGNITLEFDLTERVDIRATNIIALDIKAQDIKAGNINAGNINAGHINAWDIDAWHIDAENIDAGNIEARHIYANNIDAWSIRALNINAKNINAKNINAHHITYYAACISYKDITCYSIKGRRENSFHKCLDGKLTIKEKENHENI